MTIANNEEGVTGLAMLPGLNRLPLINTALRDAEEALNKAIDQMKAM